MQKPLFQIVGQSWETNVAAGVKQINMAIVPLIQPQNADINLLKAENQELRQLINKLKIIVNKKAR
tara:strand:+ start:186 stop:383 length:198 start_codon:yes stop_codon:yes gene_type:complete